MVMIAQQTGGLRRSVHVVKKPADNPLSVAVLLGAKWLGYRQCKHGHFKREDGELYADAIGAAYYFYTQRVEFGTPLYPLFQEINGLDLKREIAYYPADLYTVRKSEDLLTVLINLNDFYDFSFTKIGTFLKQAGY